MTYTCVSVALRNVFHANPIRARAHTHPDTHTHTHHILSAPRSIHRMTIHFFFHTPMTTRSSPTLPVWFVELQTYVGRLFNLSFDQRRAALKHYSGRLQDLWQHLCEDPHSKHESFGFLCEVCMRNTGAALLIRAQESVTHHRNTFW